MKLARAKDMPAGYDNGKPATVVPFTRWQANDQPEDSPVGTLRITGGSSRK